MPTAAFYIVLNTHSDSDTGMLWFASCPWEGSTPEEGLGSLPVHDVWTLF
jgi:hypothetical protein